MLRWSIIAASVAALAWPIIAAADDFKIPPTPDHFITDNAGMLSSNARESIESELQTYERATGHQIIVWIGDTTGGIPLETWTSETANRWKVGRRGHDDGAILFLFKQDRAIRIEVGYGLESALTDADSHRIIANVIRPRLRDGDADGAVTDGIAAMLTTITPSYKGVTPPPEAAATGANSSGVNNLVITLVGLFALVFVFAIVMQVIRAVRYGYLVLREGPTAARKDMRNWAAWGSGMVIGSAMGGGGFGSGFGGGFSGGGGSFGGGGASGGW